MKNTTLFVLAILAILISINGCNPDIIVEPLDDPNTTLVEPLDDSDTTPEQMNNVVSANNYFAFDMYSEIEEGENLFFSPYSVSTAMAMVYEGAKGQTADEIKEVFYYPEDDVLRSGMAGIYNEINKKDKEYLLSTANALWAQEAYPFLESYTSIVEQYYGGRVTNMNFISKSEESRVIINNWVEERTNDRIKDLIPPGSINSMTRLVLTNAIYFKGKWDIEFDKEDTREEEFTLDSGDKIQVDMMHNTENFGYYEDGNMQILEMDYKGKELSMLVLLPKNDISSLDGIISKARLEEWNDALYKPEVIVSMPKFTFETKYTEMGQNLVNLGMPTAFTEAADFSGMEDGFEDFYIDFVIHQAFVEVDEEGTEAAAATTIGIVGTSAGGSSEVIRFTADHPFIFIIQHKETGNILFMGKVMDPSA